MQEASVDYSRSFYLCVLEPLCGLFEHSFVVWGRFHPVSSCTPLVPDGDGTLLMCVSRRDISSHLPKRDKSEQLQAAQSDER